MSSPIAHSFAGLWTFLVFRKHQKIRLSADWSRWMPQLGILVLLANAADGDFLAGMLCAGEANAFHRSFTHSITFALALALMLTLVWRIANPWWHSCALYFAALASHLLIDMCTGSALGWNQTAYGVPLLWPWTNCSFRSPLVLVLGIQHQTLYRLFSIENVQTGLYELLVFGTVTMVVLAKQRTEPLVTTYSSPKRCGHPSISPRESGSPPPQQR